ncbi:MAG: Endoribonuclease YbeY [Firmicutes bacterium ADurb.Bin153]|mgnify:CR=1 FL=1|nr:MAG: Endoribonuclease YbeY [Firmicutes bacterium ADurb.Bin153]
MHKVAVEFAYEPEGLMDAAGATTSLVEDAVGRCIRAYAPEGTYEVSVLITDDEGIRKLNLRYRGKDTSTDVLSFPMCEDDEEDEDPEILNLLGDIVISLETAGRQAEEYGHPIEREVAYLSVHGALHLLGYDHEEESDKAEMRLAEEDVLSGMGRTR